MEKISGNNSSAGGVPTGLRQETLVLHVHTAPISVLPVVLQKRVIWTGSSPSACQFAIPCWRVNSLFTHLQFSFKTRDLTSSNWKFSEGNRRHVPSGRYPRGSPWAPISSPRSAVYVYTKNYKTVLTSALSASTSSSEFKKLALNPFEQLLCSEHCSTAVNMKCLFS